MRGRPTIEGRRVAVAAALLCASLLASGVGPVTAASTLDPHEQRLREARSLYLEGHYAEADALAREVLASVEATYGSGSRQGADVLDLVVEIPCAGLVGQTSEVLELALRAVSIREALDSEDQRLATSLHFLAMIYRTFNATT